MKKLIEIVDTTVRDGEQTKGVSYRKEEKLIIVRRLLEEVKVSRCEVCSAKVSPDEQVGLTHLMAWAKSAKMQDRIEALSFTDYDKSIAWLEPTGCRRINLLTKGSQRHCELQLKKTLQEHLTDVEKTVKYAQDKGFKINVYLEDWSNGIKDSPNYVWKMLEAYSKFGFDKILLPDTLGILNPFTTQKYIAETVKRFPNMAYEFHAHNDYGMATGNSLAAIMAGASGVHVTVNSLGERTGNVDLAQIVTTINDHTNFTTTVDEKKLKEASQLVETFSGKRIAWNMPIVGNDVFTQIAGIHADGDKKGNLYASSLTPDRFDRNRDYALGKLSGKANIEMNLRKLGISLNEDQKAKILEKVVELGDLKKNVTVYDLPFLVADMFGAQRYKTFRVVGCVVTTTMKMKPSANIQVEYNGEIYEETAVGSGGFDAFMIALRKLAPKMGIEIPKLIDFEITIPPGGNSNSIVEANIKWDNGMTTHAVSSDQVKASIKATERVINLIYSKELLKEE
ncbi:MAG: alpha-isopropylmalate synthase regulatory domain-containing protein [Alphaproteobacteria bacterium]|nr:alpha-isopropylmalate synthase regulatory domain-containing protein [Alphaproteobacteria bacterium]